MSVVYSQIHCRDGRSRIALMILTYCYGLRIYVSLMHIVTNKNCTVPEDHGQTPFRGRFWHDSKDLLSEPGVLYLAIRSLSGRLGFPGHIKQIVGRSRSLTRTDSIAWRRSVSVSSSDTGRCRLAGDPGSSTSSTSSGTGRRQGRVGRGVGRPSSTGRTQSSQSSR
jgi:hypothetical protein